MEVAVLQGSDKHNLLHQVEVPQMLLFRWMYERLLDSTFH